MNLSLARFISVIFNPLVVMVFVPFFLVIKTTGNFTDAISWTIYSFVFLLALTGLVVYGVKKKKITDIDVSRREQRPLLYFTAEIFSTIYLAGLYLFHAPFVLIVGAFTIIIGIAFMGIINTKIKASLHVATTSSLITALALVYRGYYLLFLLLIPIIGTARVAIKRHTTPEVIAGGVIGSLLSLGTYSILYLFFH